MTTGAEAVTWAEIAKVGAIIVAVITGTWVLRGSFGKLRDECQGLAVKLQALCGKVDQLNGAVATNSEFRRDHLESHATDAVDEAVAMTKLQADVEAMRGHLGDGMQAVLNKLETLRFVDPGGEGSPGGE